MKHTLAKNLRPILSGTVECDIDKALFRLQDDTDGSTDLEHALLVCQGVDGDMYVAVGGSRLLRFRSWTGGGRSLATHNALRVLAEAIRMDSEKNPDMFIGVNKTQ